MLENDSPRVGQLHDPTPGTWNSVSEVNVSFVLMMFAGATEYLGLPGRRPCSSAGHPAAGGGQKTEFVKMWWSLCAQALSGQCEARTQSSVSHDTCLAVAEVVLRLVRLMTDLAQSQKFDAGTLIYVIRLSCGWSRLASLAEFLPVSVPRLDIRPHPHRSRTSRSV